MTEKNLTHLVDIVAVKAPRIARAGTFRRGRGLIGVSGWYTQCLQGRLET